MFESNIFIRTKCPKSGANTVAAKAIIEPVCSELVRCSCFWSYRLFAKKCLCKDNILYATFSVRNNFLFLDNRLLLWSSFSLLRENKTKQSFKYGNTESEFPNPQLPGWRSRKCYQHFQKRNRTLEMVGLQVKFSSTIFQSDIFKTDRHFMEVSGFQMARIKINFGS